MWAERRLIFMCFPGGCRLGRQYRRLAKRVSNRSFGSN
jgi:hypothetical protein